jgi:hypothetical protein
MSREGKLGARYKFIKSVSMVAIALVAPVFLSARARPSSFRIFSSSLSTDTERSFFLES